MHASILERALHLFPEVDFVNAYGLTETSSTVAILGPDDHRLALYSDEPLFKNRLSSVGQPLPGIEIRIVGDAGDTMGPDEPGEIQIRGDQVSGKYVGTDSKIDADGWLHTGDRGWLDVEGYLFCEGRADDTIIRGGENIAPAEVEDALLQHDAISVAAVVGLDDERYGERIAAMVSLRAGVEEIDTDHVREWVRERLGSLKTPELVVVADEVPQTATGKILRRQVKADLGGQHSNRSTPLRRPPPVIARSHPRRAAPAPSLVTSSSRSGWPLRVPSRKATVIVLTSSNAGSPGCVYGGTWLELQASPSSGAR